MDGILRGDEDADPAMTINIAAPKMGNCEEPGPKHRSRTGAKTGSKEDGEEGRRQGNGKKMRREI